MLPTSNPDRLQTSLGNRTADDFELLLLRDADHCCSGRSRVLRWVVAVCVLLSTVVFAGRISAQDSLGAPTVGAVTPAAVSLTVPWTAPSPDRGSPIVAYAIRYIATDASDKTHDQWTVVASAW